ncbi:MAG TPA: transcriptional regulator [Clostridiales bacterium]|nr:transcriptional regulator [Clostridiales bacterium]
MDWQTAKKRLLENSELKNAYDELGPEYTLIVQLIQARIDSGMTQAQLADLVGTKQSDISRLESGAYNPSIGFLRKVARGLGKSLDVRLV